MLRPHASGIYFFKMSFDNEINITTFSSGL